MPSKEFKNQQKSLIKSACDAFLIRKGHTPQRHEPTYWWNENFLNAKTEGLKARRKYQRSRGTDSFFVLQEIFASKGRNKKECFHKPCDDVDVNPWGQAYRIVMKKLNGFKQASAKIP